MEDSGFDDSRIKALISELQKQADATSINPQLRPNPQLNVAPKVIEQLKRQPGLRNLSREEMQAYSLSMLIKGGDAVEKPAVG